MWRTAALALSLSAPATAIASGTPTGYGPCWDVATATEREIMRNESRGWTTADNPRSTAYGCSQGLLSTRRRYADDCGVSASTLSVEGQMCIFRSYIADRYGSASKALAYRRAHGWY